MNAAPAIRPFPVTDTVQRIWAEIERLELLRNIAELETFGYTVVPPEKVALHSVRAIIRKEKARVVRSAESVAKHAFD